MSRLDILYKHLRTISHSRPNPLFTLYELKLYDDGSGRLEFIDHTESFDNPLYIRREVIASFSTIRKGIEQLEQYMETCKKEDEATADLAAGRYTQYASMEEFIDSL